MDRKLFTVTAISFFLIGLLVGLLKGYPTQTKAQVLQSKVIVLSDSETAELCNCYREMLKMYYRYKDYEEYDFIKDEYYGKYNFWWDCISETDAYDKANTILQGDWGDFYNE